MKRVLIFPVFSKEEDMELYIQRKRRKQRLINSKGKFCQANCQATVNKTEKEVGQANCHGEREN